MSDELRSLDRLTISNPCNADWASMSGNDQVRFCEHCSLHVTNLSNMALQGGFWWPVLRVACVCVSWKLRAAGF